MDEATPPEGAWVRRGNAIVIQLEPPTWERDSPAEEEEQFIGDFLRRLRQRRGAASVGPSQTPPRGPQLGPYRTPGQVFPEPEPPPSENIPELRRAIALLEQRAQTALDRLRVASSIGGSTEAQAREEYLRVWSELRWMRSRLQRALGQASGR